MSAVDVVVVNWNGGQSLADCVRSVLAVEPDEVASLVVVDNGSRDGSDQMVAAVDGVRLIRSGGNIGFGRACNLGAATGTAPFILLLNPDTRLTEPCIAAARTFLSSPAGAPFAVCGIMHRDEQGDIARHCARFPSVATFAGELSGLSRLAPHRFPPLHLKEFDHRTSRPVDHVMAAFALVRREAFAAIGGFDPDYFVYLEDLDLSARLAARGGATFYLADVAITHQGGGTTRAIKARALFYVLDARLVYADHHFGRTGRAIITALTLIVDPITRSAFHLASGGWRDVPAVWHAHALLWRRLLRGRRTVLPQLYTAPS